MGSTFDGTYEPVAEVAKALDAVQEKHGWDIPIHVDGASGGFVAPFLQPDLEWDFRVPRVQSINTSGHKYGLVYPGVGWVVFRDQAALPDDLVFHVSYLGGDMIDFSINFSRPGNQVIAQYYNFLRLGLDGYARIQQASQDVALHLSGEIAKMGPFRLITKGDDLPVFCWTMDETYAKSANFSLYDLADKLRERGWLVPAYPMPENRGDLVVQRIVVKEDFSRDLADRLLEDLRRAVAYFESQTGHTAEVGRLPLPPLRGQVGRRSDRGFLGRIRVRAGTSAGAPVRRPRPLRDPSDPPAAEWAPPRGPLAAPPQGPAASRGGDCRRGHRGAAHASWGIPPYLGAASARLVDRGALRRRLAPLPGRRAGGDLARRGAGRAARPGDPGLGLLRGLDLLHQRGLAPVARGPERRRGHRPGRGAAPLALARLAPAQPRLPGLRGPAGGHDPVQLQHRGRHDPGARPGASRTC